eukprot:8306862-Prorocentrum_lima.AAC.1
MDSGASINVCPPWYAADTPTTQSDLKGRRFLAANGDELRELGTKAVQGKVATASGTSSSIE